MKRRIAVILVNYRNREDTLACIRSLEGTDHGSLALYIVDNASGEGSAEAIQGYLDASPLASHLLPLSGNLGYAGGVNAGMRKAIESGADFLLIMNNDVRVGEDFGPKLLQACETHPGTVLAGSVLGEATGEPAHNVGRISRYTLRIDYYFRDLEKRPIDFVSGCLMLIPKDVVARAGYFDERYFMYCEDLEYCLRLRRMRIPIVYVPQIRIWHKINSTVDKAGFAKEYYLIRNQTHISMTQGGWGQRILFGISLGITILLKARHPKLFLEFNRAVRDAVFNRLGKR